MAEFTDKRTGKRVSVPDAQVGDFLASPEAANFSADAGTIIKVKSDTGDIGDVSIENLASVTGAGGGFSIATQADLAERERVRQHGEGVGNAVIAGADSAFREATLGFGDAIQVKLGRDAESISAKRELNELSSGIGAGIGIVAPILASGGGAAVAQGGAKLTARGIAGQALRLTPTSLVARAGRVADDAIVSRLGGGAIARGTSAGAVGAAEGAAFGVGSATSDLALQGEDALGDHETVSEYLLAAAQDGAMLGGGAGVVLGTGIGVLGKGFKKVKDLTFRRTAGLADDASDGAVSKAIRDDMAEAGSTKGSANFIKEKIRQRGVARNLDDLQGSSVKASRGKVDRIEQLNDNIMDAASGAKPKDIRKLMRRGGADAPATLDNVADQADTAITSLRRRIDEHFDSPDARDRGAARRLKKVLDDAENDLGILTSQTSASGKNLANLAGDSFARIDRLKQSIGRFQARLGGKAVAKTDEAFVFGDQLRREYDNFRELLENESLWGQGAARSQAGVNAKWTQWFDTAEPFRRSFLKDFGGERAAGGFAQVDVANEKALGSFLRTVGKRGQDTDQLEEIYIRQLQAKAELMDELSRRPGVSKAAAAESRRLTDETLDELQRAKGNNTDADAFNELAGDFAGIPFIPGAAKSVVILAEKAAQLAKLGQGTNQVAAKISKATKQFTDTMARTGKVSKRAVAPLTAGRAKGESKHDFYKRKRDRIAEFTADPTKIAQAAERHASDAAPNVTAALTMTAARGAQFLQSKLPFERPGSLVRQDLDDTQRVSDAQMNKFLRYSRAVENPLSVFEDMENGDITREGVEALQAVYPRMYEQLVTNVTESLAALEKPPPMSSLVQLSIIMKQPMHFSMRPAFINAHQAMYAQRAEEATKRVPPSNRKAPQSAQGFATPSQQIEGAP